MFDEHPLISRCDAVFFRDGAIFSSIMLRFGIPHMHFDTVDSTNTLARALARDGCEEGAAITADHQWAGKGRNDRTWISDSGKNLLVSYVVRPERDPADWGGLALLSGIAVAEAIRAVAPCDPRLKWPNDVLISRRKVSGVLIETGFEAHRAWAIVGVGINVNQTDFAPGLRLPATSLQRESGDEIPVARVFEALSEQLGRWYGLWLREGNPAIIEQWKYRTDMIGKMVRVSELGAEAFHKVLDLNFDGSLSLMDEAGHLIAVHAGDVSVRDTEDAVEES
jgi:BirA family transcriptional regulator, biotin operon repressor / biotin---[acetyl-CoA-carboxylase] ligase